jgi:mRNA interferase RelE/StbE
MRYQIQIERRALKALEAIQARDRQRIRMAIRDLGENPRPQGCKKLADSANWRIRIGVYRVVYRVEEAQLFVLVIKIGHRKDVYR